MIICIEDGVHSIIRLENVTIFQTKEIAIRNKPCTLNDDIKIVI